MAGWAELLTLSVRSLPKQVFLCVGEQSSLVWDVVHKALAGYDTFVRVESDIDLSYAMTGLGNNAAYLLVDPTPELLGTAEALVRGSTSEAVYILMSAPPTNLAGLEYLKKKAQQSKLYFTVTAPKGEAAQQKMVSFFLMRWGLTRAIAHRACAMLDFSPGKLYQFDKSLMLATGGQVLPSSQTQALVDSLLGADTQNTVVAKIIEGQGLDADFDETFTRQVLNFIFGLVLNAKRLHGAWEAGNTTVADAGKAAGLTQYQTLQAWPLAELFPLEALRRKEKILSFMYQNYRGNPETLSTLAQLW